MVDIFVYMSYKTKDTPPGTLDEPMIAYGFTAPLSPFYNLLGGAKALKLSSDFDIVKLARNGFPKRVLLALAKRIS